MTGWVLGGPSIARARLGPCDRLYSGWAILVRDSVLTLGLGWQRAAQRAPAAGAGRAPGRAPTDLFGLGQALGNMNPMQRHLDEANQYLQAVAADPNLLLRIRDGNPPLHDALKSGDPEAVPAPPPSHPWTHARALLRTPNPETLKLEPYILDGVWWTVAQRAAMTAAEEPPLALEAETQMCQQIS